MSLRVALATHRVIHLGRVAMRFDVGGIAFERAQETSERVLVLLLATIEQAELQMHLAVGGDNRGRAEQMAQGTAKVALALEQRREPHVRFVVAGLAADQLAVNRERAERICLGDSTRLFEALAHSRRAETILDFAGLTTALEIQE